MKDSKIVKYEGRAIIKQINNSLEITNKLLSLATVKIVHFDDHRIFTEGVRNWIGRKTANILITSINEYYASLDCITKRFQICEKIDLIITDFNHPGPNGYEFAKAVKELVKEYKVFTPILLLTFVSGDEPIVLRGIEEKIFDKYLPKSAGGDEIIAAIKSLT